MAATEDEFKQRLLKLRLAALRGSPRVFCGGGSAAGPLQQLWCPMRHAMPSATSSNNNNNNNNPTRLTAAAAYHQSREQQLRQQWQLPQPTTSGMGIGGGGGAGSAPPMANP